MAEPLTMVSEHGDDRPVLVAHLDRMGLQPLLAEHVPAPGHGVGLRLGWGWVVGLPHLLCEGDHRLHHVAPWATQRLHTLQEGTGQPVQPVDVRDDRWATVLEARRDETPGQACAGALKQPPRRVDDLQPACVRRDRPTATGHWSVTAEGLLQCGPRQDQRPDLPQVKRRVSAVEPRGLPVAPDVVPGQRADAPVSIPTIARVQERLGRRGRR